MDHNKRLESLGQVFGPLRIMVLQLSSKLALCIYETPWMRHAVQADPQKGILRDRAAGPTWLHFTTCPAPKSTMASYGWLEPGKLKIVKASRGGRGPALSYASSLTLAGSCCRDETNMGQVHWASGRWSFGSSEHIHLQGDSMEKQLSEVVRSCIDRAGIGSCFDFKTAQWVERMLLHCKQAVSSESCFKPGLNKQYVRPARSGLMLHELTLTLLCSAWF